MQIQALGTGTGLGQALSVTNTGAARSSQAPAVSSANARASSAAQTASTATYDVMDTNKDGYVSFWELVAYLFKNPGSAQATQSAQAAVNGPENQAGSVAAYNRRGTAEQDVSKAQLLVDLFA